MDAKLKRIAVSLLLAAGVGNACAQSVLDRMREAGFTFYPQRTAMEQGAPGNGQPQRPPDRRGRDGAADSSGFGADNGNSSSNAEQEAARKQSRLSPEERRALRRQIDEAGHDIYKRKR